MSISLLRQRGINMMEVLVTIIITSVGLLGLNSLQLQANRAATDSGNRSQAVWMLEDLANRMYANKVGLDSYNTNGNSVSCNAAPTKICSAHNNGTQRVAAKTDCSPSEQATSDLWEVACGFEANNGNILFTNAVDFMSNPSLSVTLDANKHATLTMSWDVRTSGVDANGKKVYTVSKNNNTNATLRDSISMELQP